MPKPGSVCLRFNAQPSRCHLLLQVYWSRASRTDKGVSAAANVASLLVPAHIANSLESWKDALNAALPSSIRVWGAVIVPRHFDARACCVGRRWGDRQAGHQH